MITKIFRPFWSYDVQKTEEWLSSMAEKGHQLVKINKGTRLFIFEQAEPRKRTYRIGFDKIQPHLLSKVLLDDGWVKILQSGRWYVTANEQPQELIKTFPVREGIVKHNKSIGYIFASVLIYLTIIVMFNLIIRSTLFFQDVPVHFVESPLWILTYSSMGIGIALWVLALYSVMKINKINKKLIAENTHRKKLQGSGTVERRLSQDEEKWLMRSGQLVVKRRIAWMYAPDKLEKWLEAMEEQGLNLFRVGKTGTVFYFKIGSPRKISYCADYQNNTDESYFDIHRDAGWESAYVSTSSFQKWTLWSREYSMGEEEPQIYSDKSHQLKHARRIAVTYSCMFIPLVIFNILFIGANIHQMFNYNLDKIELLNMILFVILILIYGSFSIRTWLYYRRLSKRYNYNM
ncbi:hypothetical protein PVOR_17479 [Paenibacillus vortex V453]|uniref:DUF2812 domain-containing protein n=1 Tax=Paenibacillus vortex V453 TaxID=715225 RepID=A0A2R9STI8_9BACL|nr:DUF2812 domain-containing protein [Paenibacillus vortex]EFU40686.1 hypothetical protein PVOR_17479 [Paenibacillus vortex V453]